jgi:hypothetical protein
MYIQKVLDWDHSVNKLDVIGGFTLITDKHRDVRYELLNDEYIITYTGGKQFYNIVDPPNTELTDILYTKKEMLIRRKVDPIVSINLTLLECVPYAYRPVVKKYGGVQLCMDGTTTYFMFADHATRDGAISMNEDKRDVRLVGNMGSVVINEVGTPNTFAYKDYKYNMDITMNVLGAIDIKFVNEDKLRALTLSSYGDNMLMASTLE